MAEESKGHNSATRIDRIERAIEALIDAHDRLPESHEDLLRAQVITHDNMAAMAATVKALSEKVASHEDSIQALVDSQLRVDRVLERIQKLLEDRGATET
jgi:phosphopantothenate synthetase